MNEPIIINNYAIRRNRTTIKNFQQHQSRATTIDPSVRPSFVYYMNLWDAMTRSWKQEDQGKIDAEFAMLQDINRELSLIISTFEGDFAESARLVKLNRVVNQFITTHKEMLVEYVSSSASLDRKMDLATNLRVLMKQALINGKLIIPPREEIKYVWER